MQRRRCRAYCWCTGHAGPSELEHHGKAQIVCCGGGRELRFVLTAVGDGPLRVTVEVLLAEGEPPLEVVDLQPAEVLQAAAVLRGLVVDSEHAVEQ